MGECFYSKEREMKRRDFLSSFIMGMLGGICALFGFDVFTPKERIGSRLILPVETIDIPIVEPNLMPHEADALFQSHRISYDEMSKRLFNSSYHSQAVQGLWDIAEKYELDK